MDLEALQALSESTTRPWLKVFKIIAAMLVVSILGNAYQLMEMSKRETEVNIVADAQNSYNSNISQVQE